ncbi:major facilitator superfamily transporter [Plectosphaerella cucumerina]|uniref:Molybdate-anion transporter n=1 Tax=Plectosphaerella cucumerina TaxID=40658 RepID=A0A8K0XAF5_9PEZI|nr:major facilitator superfamily transporter [Plectosphaerella cucumerina]
MLDTYQLNLAGLVLACGVLLALPSSSPKASRKSPLKPGAKPKSGKKASQWAFFTVYALVMASDWLQGPFLYSLYKTDHAVPSHIIPRLFTTGFLSGALTAPFIGSLADRHGRRTACLVFCLASAASCLLTAFGTSLPLLFLGRVLGGFATSLLFSVFESWMVTDFGNRRLAEKGADLSRTFGLMSTVNSVVAIISGVVSEWLVGAAGSAKAPFAASAAIVVVASLFISTQWDENYGTTGQAAATTSSPKDKTTTAPSLWSTLTSKGVLALALATTTFEGSMYLFVVLWAPLLQSASAAPESLPYGLIFAAFMSTTLLSSLLYPRLSRGAAPSSVLSAVLAVSAAIFIALASSSGPGASEQRVFWLFCTFEAAVGAYFPAAGVLKGSVVPDGVRAQVYAALRVPLNAFVVLSLVLMGEGTADAAATVFGLCGALLLGGAGAVWVVG